MFYWKILSFLSETKNARVIEVYKIHESYCLVKKKGKDWLSIFITSKKIQTLRYLMRYYNFFTESNVRDIYD